MINKGNNAGLTGCVFHGLPILLAILSCPGFQQVSAQGEEQDHARLIIEHLAGSSMHGRGFVYHGAGKAAKYITRKFKKYGAMPVNGSYSQPFCVDANTFPGRCNLSIDGIPLKPVSDYLPEPCSPGLKGDFGLIAINPDDILSGNFLSKFRRATERHLLLLNFPDADSLDPSLKKSMQGFLEKIQQEAPTRASGFVQMTGKKLSWYASRTTCGKPWIIMNRTVNIDSLSRLDVHIHNRLITGGQTRNIMGIVRGTLKPDSFIVFTAHYDHLGSLGRKAFFPGANDNASGVALMLSLMKYFAEHPPSWSLLFLSPSAEELGLLGSTYFVMNPPVDLQRMRFMINLDLLGTGEEGIMVMNAGEHLAEFNILTGINKSDSLVPAIKSRGETCISDHCPFYQCGVPCFYIYTLGGSKAYHDLNDTPDALSLAAFEGCRKLIIRFVERL
jgi:aminopeptidase YwaD